MTPSDKKLGELAEKAKQYVVKFGEPENGAYLCPLCDGEGELWANTVQEIEPQHVVGIQYFGVGDAFYDLQKFTDAASPGTILTLLSEKASEKARADAAEASVAVLVEALKEACATECKMRDEAKRVMDREGVHRYGEAAHALANLKARVLALIDGTAAQSHLEYVRGLEGENARIPTLCVAIAHGDDDHRKWLHDAISAHFAGKDVPAVYGRGKLEADRDQWKARAEKAEAEFAEMKFRAEAAEECAENRGRGLMQMQLDLAEARANARTPGTDAFPHGAALNPENLQEARSHLGAALVQTIDSDDQIIMEHVRSAYRALGGTP